MIEENMDKTMIAATWNAAREGDWEQVCRSIEQEPELIRQDGWSYDVCEDTMRHDFPMLSFLHVAAVTAPEIKYVQYFMDRGLDRDLPNEYGTPPIFYAACNPNIEMLRYFIESGADMFSETRSAKTLLHFAAANNRSIDVIKYLVAKGLDVNKPDSFYRETPLHYAVSGGNIEAMLYLAENGADLNADSDNMFGNTPFMILLEDNYITSVDPSLVKRFIELGAAPNSIDRRHFTPLYYSGMRSLDVIKCLVEHDAKIIKSDTFGIAPLHYAVMNPCLDNIKYLIELGADPCAVNRDGTTLLHVAARSNPNVEMLIFLVDQGVDINAKRDETQMAIHDALERRCDFETLKFFVENGSDLNTRGSSWHHTPLEEVALWCDSDIYRDKYEYVKYLVEHGADWTVKTSDGATLLHHSDNLRLTEYLVSLGLDVNASDDHGNTPVMWAAGRRQSSPDVLKFLVTQGGNLDVRDNEGVTPIHYAAGRQSSDILEYLVSQGENVNVQDNKGKTPLHHVVMWDQGSPETWTYLIEHGADIHSKDNEGKSPLDLARGEEKKNLLLELKRKHKTKR